jgi:hypothetical protein
VCQPCSALAISRAAPRRLHALRMRTVAAGLPALAPRQQLVGRQRARYGCVDVLATSVLALEHLLATGLHAAAYTLCADHSSGILLITTIQSARTVMCAAGDAAAELPLAERSQFEKFTELLTTLFPVWVRPT